MAKHDDNELGYRLAELGVRFGYQPQALGYHRFVKGLEAGLHDAMTNGASAVRLTHFHPELSPAPVATIWRHYPRLIRPFLRYLFTRPARQRQLTAWSRTLLYKVAEGPLPFAAKRPFFRLAYHLYFWQGVCMEAGPDEWVHYCASVL